MISKITVVDDCGAHCTTCPNWKISPKQRMTPEFFGQALDTLWPYIYCLCVNGTGDYLSLPNHQVYSDILAERFNKGGVTVYVTTVGGFIGDTPRISASAICCSLNATTPETFAKHIGVSGGLDRVVTNIRAIIATHPEVEIHSLVWEGNPHPHEALLNFFGDTHARIRISEKVENQCTSIVTAPRQYCDYLDMLMVTSDGTIRSCCHDWQNSCIFGTIADIPAAIQQREQKQIQHRAGVWDGICKQCNYNISNIPPIYYIK
jgi:hypothetical protein